MSLLDHKMHLAGMVASCDNFVNPVYSVLLPHPLVGGTVDKA